MLKVVTQCKTLLKFIQEVFLSSPKAWLYMYTFLHLFRNTLYYTATHVWSFMAFIVSVRALTHELRTDSTTPYHLNYKARCGMRNRKESFDVTEGNKKISSYSLNNFISLARHMKKFSVLIWLWTLEYLNTSAAKVLLFNLKPETLKKKNTIV